MLDSQGGLQQQEKAIASLSDWAKWVASLNFGAAAGCVLILQRVTRLDLKVLPIVTVFFFALSMLIAVIVLSTFPSLIQRLPLQDGSGNPRSIYHYEIRPGLPLELLVRLQLSTFVVALTLLIWWMALRPVPPK
jgi:hypothetical protein